MEIVVKHGKYAIEGKATGTDAAGRPFTTTATLGLYMTKVAAEKALKEFQESGEKVEATEPERSLLDVGEMIEKADQPKEEVEQPQEKPVKKKTRKKKTKKKSE